MRFGTLRQRLPVPGSRFFHVRRPGKRERAASPFVPNIALHEARVDRSVKGGVIELEREIFGTAVLGGPAPPGPEFNPVGGDPVVGSPVMLPGYGPDGRLDVDVEGADRAVEDAVFGAGKGADLCHCRISCQCIDAAPCGLDGGLQATGRLARTRRAAAQRRTASARVFASRGMRVSAGEKAWPSRCGSKAGMVPDTPLREAVWGGSNRHPGIRCRTTVAGRIEPWQQTGRPLLRRHDRAGAARWKPVT
jgi:hypothetical protein